MKIVTILICASFFLLLGKVPGYAIDQSICGDESDVVLYDDGSLQSCTLKNEYSANGITCKDDNQITFYNNGALKSSVLSNEATINDIKCGQDRMINFYQDGNLYTCFKTSE